LATQFLRQPATASNPATTRKPVPGSGTTIHWIAWIVPSRVAAIPTMLPSASMPCASE
jgi:hypothetical protein